MLTFQPRRLLQGIKELPFPVWLRSHKGSPCARLEFTAAAAPGPGMTRDTAGQGHTKRRALLPSPAPVCRDYLSGAIPEDKRERRGAGLEVPPRRLPGGVFPSLFSLRVCFLPVFWVLWGSVRPRSVPGVESRAWNFSAFRNHAQHNRGGAAPLNITFSQPGGKKGMFPAFSSGCRAQGRFHLRHLPAPARTNGCPGVESCLELGIPQRWRGGFLAHELQSNSRAASRLLPMGAGEGS